MPSIKILSPEYSKREVETEGSRVNQNAGPSSPDETFCSAVVLSDLFATQESGFPVQSPLSKCPNRVTEEWKDKSTRAFLLTVFWLCLTFSDNQGWEVLGNSQARKYAINKLSMNIFRGVSGWGNRGSHEMTYVREVLYLSSVFSTDDRPNRKMPRTPAGLT